MRHGLNHTLVHVQAGGDQAFAVTGGTGPGDIGAIRQGLPNLPDNIRGGNQRTVLMDPIGGPDNGLVVIDQNGLDGGASRVNPQEVRPLGPRQIPGWDDLGTVPVVKLLVLLRIQKEGTDGPGRRGRVLQTGQSGKHTIQRRQIEMPGPAAILCDFLRVGPPSRNRRPAPLFVADQTGCTAILHRILESQPVQVGGLLGSGPVDLLLVQSPCRAEGVIHVGIR